MQIVAFLIFIGLIFGLCFLVDKLFTRLFRNRKEHRSGLAVHYNKRTALFGLLLAVLGIFSTITGVEKSRFLLIGGIVVLIGGILLLAYYLSFGIYYDDKTILVSGFLKKNRSFAYGDIVHQTVLIAGGSLMAEVYFENGSAITVQAHMDGGIAFLDYAFARWCEVKGLNPKECAFHDPSKFRWFPAEEESGEEEDT